MCPPCRQPVLCTEGTENCRAGWDWLGWGSKCNYWKRVLVPREASCDIPRIQMDGDVVAKGAGKSPSPSVSEFSDGRMGVRVKAGRPSGGRAACGRDPERTATWGGVQGRNLAGTKASGG